MNSVSTLSATTAPPIILQASRVRRRIAASDAVASLVASLAFGEPRGEAWVWPAPAERVGAGVRL